MPAAVAVPAIMGAVGIGTSLFGASQQASAATSAAATQAAAAKAAGQVAQTQANAGAAAITGQIPVANDTVTGASQSANALLQAGNQANQSNNQGFLQTGNAAAAQLSSMANGPGFTWDPSTDPGYQFRMQQGMKALQNSAAARGASLGGSAIKATTQYAQNYATQEYQNAFNNFQTNRTNTANMLTPLISAGTTAAGLDQSSNNFYTGTASGNTMAAGTFAGSNDMAGTVQAANLQQQGANAYANALTNAGNAQAAGTVGSANAWANGLSGATNSATNAGLLYMLGQKGANPAAPPSTYIPPDTAPNPWGNG